MRSKVTDDDSWRGVPTLYLPQGHDPVKVRSKVNLAEGYSDLLLLLKTNNTQISEGYLI